MNKNAKWLIIAGIGVFLLLQKVWIGWLILAYAFYRYVHHAADPKNRLLQRIKEDARKRNISIPADSNVWKQLCTLYQRYEYSAQRFQSLKPSYDQLIEELWYELSGSNRSYEWCEQIKFLIDNWPVPDQAVDRLGVSISKVKQDTEFWRAAKAEAYGSARS